MRTVLSIILLLLSFSIAKAQNWYADSSLSWSNYYQLASPSNEKLGLYSANYFSGHFIPKINVAESRYALFSTVPIQQSFDFSLDYDGLAVSDVKFLSGFGEGQALRVLHQQRLNKHKLLGNFYANRSSGLMRNQSLKHTQLGLKIEGPISKRFSYKSKAFVGSYEQQLNGGLSNDSVLFNEINQFELLSVNLLNAKQIHRDREAMLKLMYGFKGQYSNDSIPQFLSWKHHIYFKAKYKSNSRVFTDQSLNADFYPAIYLDSALSNDCTLVSNFSQSIGASFNNGSGGSLQFELDHTYRSFYAISAGGGQSDVRIKARVKSPKGEENKYGLEANYALYGYFLGDYKLAVQNEKKILGELSYFAQLKLLKQQALPFYSSYLSNHQFWNKSLKNEQHRELELGLKGYGLTAKLFYRNSSNYIYFNRESIHQLDENLQVVGLSAQADVRIGRFQLLQQLSLQRGSNAVFNLPSTISRSAASVEFKVFKADIPIRLGLDYLYIDGLANAFYSPSLGRVVYQEGTSYEALHRIDAILAMQVKTVRVYVKANNLLSLLTESRQLYLPGYMLSPTNVQLALSWRVFD